MKKKDITFSTNLYFQTIVIWTLLGLCTSQELVRSPHYSGPMYEANEEPTESESEEDFRIPEKEAVGQSRYGLAEDIAEAASEIQEAMKDLQQSAIWPGASGKAYTNKNGGEYIPDGEYTTVNDGDHFTGSETYPRAVHRYPENVSQFRSNKSQKNPPLKRSYGDKDHLNGTNPTSSSYNATGNDQDTSGSDAQEETAGSDVHDDASEKSEGIDHEPGNIPFEWRVQLIHRNMGDSWKNRRDQAHGDASGQNDQWYDRFTDHMAHGHMRERYTKKKVDILIEEWWNKEKWNRKYWDDHADEDEGDQKHHSNHYHNSDGHKHHYGKGQGDYDKGGRGHSRGSHKRGRKGGRGYHKPRYSSSGSSYYEDVAPSHFVLRNDTNRTGDHKLHRGEYGTVDTSGYYGDPGDVMRKKPRLRSRPIKTWNAYQPKMAASSFSRPPLDGRPACARPQDPFCETDYSYPNDVIRRLIAANESAWRALSASAQARWKPFVFRPNKEATSQSPATSSSECRGDVREVRPLWAPNYNGKWKIIINTGKYVQTFMMDSCSKRTWVCARSQDFTCKQKKGILPLVALDLTSTPHELQTDWFVLPSTCVCKPKTY